MVEEQELSMETKKAIEETAQHWERMIKWAKGRPGENDVDFVYMARTLEESIGATSCPLCQRYQGLSCYACPLGKKFGKCAETNTKNYYGLTADSQTWGEFVLNAENFLSQIKSLLPQRKPLDFYKPLVDTCGIDLTFCGVREIYVVKLENGLETFVDEFGCLYNGLLYVRQKPEEPPYKPVCIGDTIMVNSVTLRINSWGKLLIGLNNLEGSRYNTTPIKVTSVYQISLEEFRLLIGESTDRPWQEVYSTLKRR